MSFSQRVCVFSAAKTGHERCRLPLDVLLLVPIASNEG